MQTIAIEPAVLQEIAMILNDAFGLSGGAGCVDKKSQTVGGNRQPWVLYRERRRHVVDIEHSTAVMSIFSCHRKIRAVGEQQTGLRVFQQKAISAFRKRRVQNNANLAGFQNC